MLMRYFYWVLMEKHIADDEDDDMGEDTDMIGNGDEIEDNAKLV